MFLFSSWVFHHRCVSLISAITWLAFWSACGKVDQNQVEEGRSGGIWVLLVPLLATKNPFVFTNVCLHLKLNYDRTVAEADFRLFHGAPEKAPIINHSWGRWVSS